MLNTMPLVLRLSVYSDEDRVRELNARCSTERFDFLAGVGTLSSTAESHSTANADWTDCPRQRHATARGGRTCQQGGCPQTSLSLRFAETMIGRMKARSSADECLSVTGSPRTC